MSASPGRPLSFLDLPKELRLMIYEAIEVTHRHHNVALECTGDPIPYRKRKAASRYPEIHITFIVKSLPMSLLATCQLIHQEASPILRTKILASPSYLFVTQLALVSHVVVAISETLSAIISKAAGIKKAMDQSTSSEPLLKLDYVYHQLKSGDFPGLSSLSSVNAAAIASFVYRTGLYLHSETNPHPSIKFALKARQNHVMPAYNMFLDTFERILDNTNSTCAHYKVIFQMMIVFPSAFYIDKTRRNSLTDAITHRHYNHTQVLNRDNEPHCIMFDRHSGIMDEDTWMLRWEVEDMRH